jgi:glyoxylase-like metal-dependent hydrolase (beta-lactamase superfamily II)
MKMTELAPGLRRWVADHPDWTPEEGGPEGWNRDVGCIAYEAPEALVLIDPLVPADDAARFHELLDRDVKRHGRPVAILLTVFWHERSAKALMERYGASLWAHPFSVERRALPVTADSPPASVVAREVVRRGEAAFWLPEHRALVVGDVLLGTDDGGLRVCSSAWVHPGGYPGVLDSLRGLLELPIEKVLVSHGEPVLEGARKAIEASIARARS